MASELHSRLEYLVNYSSQLIFVSGDSIAEQQRTLEAFVFQQSDNTELAFITAEPSMEVTEYRGTLCKQLLGQVVGTYIRPLNELLAGLNHHEGPVLITITQAQHLPNGFLQELWELVLQSRFANNKQHLNVLLFGESEWAEEAKEWLPAKNTSTPLLISSQSVSTEHYNSDVDRLLAERRAAFERYRKDRGAAGALPVSNNRLRSPWLWLAIGLVFISSFVAIMGWQYGATMTTLFNPIDSQPSQSELPELADSPAVIKPTRTLSVVKQDPTATETMAAQQSQPPAPPSQPRVMNSFNEAIKAIPPVSIATAEVSEDKVVAQNQQPAEAQELLAQPTANALVSDAAVPVSESAAQGVPKADHPRQLVFANNELANSPDGQYWIQIAGMQDLKLATDFLSDYQLTDQVKLYKTYRYGGDWFVLLWSSPAPSLNEAQQQLAALPDFPGSSKAFVKAGKQIKAEIKALSAP